MHDETNKLLYGTYLGGIEASHVIKYIVALITTIVVI